MDLRLKRLVDSTRAKFGLQHYRLEGYQFFQKVNLFNDTEYTLSMEWFPNQSAAHAEDQNPEGTAVIEIELATQKVKSVVFVNDKSFADGVKFKGKQDMINWVEQETGLVYGKQFQMQKDKTGKLSFSECADGVALYPSGWIEIQCDPQGNLTTFSAYVHVPNEQQIQKDAYSLTLDKVAELAKERLILTEIPRFEQEKRVPVYAIDEIYLSNDRKSEIPYEPIMNEHPFTPIDKTIYWDEPLGKPRKRKVLHWTDKATIEQAFSCEPSPDSLPITRPEQRMCIHEVRAFLSREYTADSGKWILKSLYRDQGYIFAAVRRVQKENPPLQRKLTLVIDRSSLHLCNFIDNNPFIDSINQFQTTGEVVVTKKAAYEKVKSYIELKPYYVYDFKQRLYVLCGKLDCDYAVNASSGEVAMLDELLQ
ncbi:hypothetical protein NIE88_01175 [Sporolactobacillus shoreicorticis]|uniref:Uncharacterized protein n=1 Tax=Sporolactobacillus shoreicorticis TaxID=1923877 RepID=A0ABW5S3Y8_9BACL|nr:hypothetical protein [Sporolactobacillus shoreicorticis]MCO7124394.1 hypothetical protein [Sporolactobacillus shoreicorticis]